MTITKRGFFVSVFISELMKGVSYRSVYRSIYRYIDRLQTLFKEVIYRHLAGLGKPAILVACLAGPFGNSLYR